jgi:hypothetical protein
MHWAFEPPAELNNEDLGRHLPVRSEARSEKRFGPKLKQRIVARAVDSDLTSTLNCTN